MVRLIKSTSKIGAFFIIVLGGIVSLWTNCVLIVNLKNKMRSEFFVSSGHDEYNNIIWTIQLTYLALFIIASGTLLWAFKKSQKLFLIPWSLLKLSENIVLLIGSFALYIRWSFYGLVPLAIISFVLNVYISLSVYKAYKKMKTRDTIKEIENDLKRIGQDETCEKCDIGTQTETTNYTINIMKTFNNANRNNKENPFNYVHTSIHNKK